MERLPNFLGVGAAKTGTTWLRLCLGEHPEIFIPGKELGFFSDHYDRGLDWYSAQYHPAAEKAIGDITPTYMICEQAAQRIYDWNPDVLLIFSFRNPIERAYSHYCMVLRSGSVSEDIDNELLPDTRFVFEGLYYQHLSRFLELFSMEQILILLHDDLKDNPKKYLQKAYRFLGVDDSFEPSMLNQRFHVRKTRPRNLGIYNFLVRGASQVYRRSAKAGTFLDEMRKSDLVNIFHRLNRGPDFPEMSLAKKQFLADYYRPDVVALSDFLNRDLTHWLSV